MARGDQNPLTVILLEAEKVIHQQELDLLEQYGLPLYTTDPGKKSPMPWPDDPDTMSPEEMQELLDTYGEESVNAWLMNVIAEKQLAADEEAEF